MKKINDTENRREFLRKGIRSLCFGGLVFLSAFLGERNLSRPDRTPACRTGLPCQDCLKLSRCGESRAIQFKHSQTSAALSPPSGKKGAADEKR